MNFLDIILVIILIFGVAFMISTFNTLIQIRRKKSDKKQLDKVYSYIILISILYILFWIIRLKQ